MTEHDAKAVEELAKHFINAGEASCRNGEWMVTPQSAARLALTREQSARERHEAATKGLVAGLEDIAQHACPQKVNDICGCKGCRARRALRAYRAAQQPEPPTLAEAVEAMSDALKAGHLVVVDETTCVLVPRSAYNATMNALARERGQVTK